MMMETIAGLGLLPKREHPYLLGLDRFRGSKGDVDMQIFNGIQEVASSILVSSTRRNPPPPEDLPAAAKLT